MTQLEKLVSKFLKEPPEVRFNDVITLLGAFGYTLHSKKGSHFAFVKKGKSTITVPTIRGRKVKRAYIRIINELLELEEWHEYETGKK